MVREPNMPDMTTTLPSYAKATTQGETVRPGVAQPGRACR
jgi:hypothetical protein